MTENMNNEEVFNDNEEDLAIITLIGEDDEEVDFALLDAIELDGKEYVVLEPAEDFEEEQDEDFEGEVVILQVETDENGEECYVPVEDDAIAQKVFDMFQAAEDDYEFGDAE